jgi:MFS family permease
MGKVYSSFLLSYMILMIAGGRIADRFGPRAVLAIGGFGTALLTGITGLCGKPGIGALIGVFPAFLLVRFALGIVTAPLYPSCARMSANWVPMVSQGWVQALIMAGAFVGAAISPVAFSRLMTAYGWRASFAIAAALTAVIYCIWVATVRDYPPGGAVTTPSTRRVPSQWGKLLTDRNLMLLTIGYFMLNYFEYIFFYWIYYYFGEVRHLGANETAWATTVLFITTAILTPLGGKISDRLVTVRGVKFGRRSVAMAGMAISAVLLYLGAGGFSLYATVAFLSLAMGFASSSEGPYWATTIEISGEHVGAACGILNTGGNLGGLLAPVLTPMIAARFGWAGGLYFASFLVTIGMLTWLMVDPARKIST